MESNSLSPPACLKIMGKLCGPQVVDKVKIVPLGDDTVKERIHNMATKNSKELHEKLRSVPRIR